MLMEGGEEARPVLTGEACPDRATKVIDPTKALLPTFAALSKSRWQPATKIAVGNNFIWMPHSAQEYGRAF